MFEKTKKQVSKLISQNDLMKQELEFSEKQYKELKLRYWQTRVELDRIKTELKNRGVTYPSIFLRRYKS